MIGHNGIRIKAISKSVICDFWVGCACEWHLDPHLYNRLPLRHFEWLGTQNGAFFLNMDRAREKASHSARESKIPPNGFNHKEYIAFAHIFQWSCQCFGLTAILFLRTSGQAMHILEIILFPLTHTALTSGYAAFRVNAKEICATFLWKFACTQYGH